jgi:hypothetical protein
MGVFGRVAHNAVQLKGTQAVGSIQEQAEGGKRNGGAAAGGEVGVFQQDLALGADGEVVDLYMGVLGG